MNDARILIVEDNALMCSELARIFGEDSRFTGVTIAQTVTEAKKALSQPFDIVLLDLQLPDGSGLDLVPMARRLQPALKFLVFTVAADEDSTLKSMELGVDGYVLKDDPDIAERVFASILGRVPLDSRVTSHLLAKLAKKPAMIELSQREEQTLNGLYRGLSYTAIADELSVSPKTVPSYIKSLYKKLEVTSRSQAVFKGIELGLV